MESVFVFRKMRRIKQQLTAEECETILNQSTSGVLALNGDGGYPYAVPLSYVYNDGVLYFQHGDLKAHRLAGDLFGAVIVGELEL